MELDGTPQDYVYFMASYFHEDNQYFVQKSLRIMIFEVRPDPSQQRESNFVAHFPQPWEFSLQWIWSHLLPLRMLGL